MRPMTRLSNTSSSLGFITKRSSVVRPIKQNCDIQRKCQSCQYVNLDYKANLQKKFDLGIQVLEEKKLLSRTRLIVPHESEQSFGYRATLKLAVRPAEDSLCLGLFHPGTHEVVDVTSCPLHLKPLQKMLTHLSPLLKEGAKAGHFTAWNEQTQSGDLRYLVARASKSTEEIQIIFVVGNTEKKNYFRDLVRDLRNNYYLNVVSAFLNVNASTGNDIFGEEFLKIAGQDQLRVAMNGSLFAASPGTFLQVNPWQAEQIYNRISQIGGRADGGEVAWDLYCGMGPIALSLAKQNYRVWGVEENPHAIHDAKLNLGRNDLSDTKASFTCGLLEESLESAPLWAENPTLIVVNPSRRGLAENVREKLRSQLSGKNRLHHLVYLSCEIKTLARDLEDLLSSGARLNQIEAFDMFPHTDKLEWLAVLTPAPRT